MGASESTESQVLALLGDVHHAGDGLAGILHFLAADVGGDETGLADLLAAHMGSVSLLDDEHASPLLLGGDTVSIDRDRGLGLGGVVETSAVVGGRAPHVLVELNEVSVVFLGEGPNDTSGLFHICQRLIKIITIVGPH